MEIAGQLRCNIYIEGNQYPFYLTGNMQVIVNQNVKTFLPSFKLYLDDSLGVLASSTPVNDGTRISIQIDDSYPSTTTTYSFRVYGTPIKNISPINPDVTRYTMVGLSDNYPYIRANPNSTIYGSSLDVMNNAASALGLTVKTNCQPNDAMAWIPGKQPWASFLHRVSSHAYVDDTSCMAHAVDIHGNLHFYNLTQKFKDNKPVAYLYRGASKDKNFTSQNSWLCVDYQTANRSTYMNSWAADGLRTVQTPMSGNPSVYNQVNATTVNNSLDINKSVYSSVQNRGRIHMVPADCGNAHSQDMNAKHQNLRLLTTYSQNIYAMMYNFTGLKLFDMVKFTATHGASDNRSSADDGLYCVTAITSTLFGNRYFEKIELTNAGPGNTNTRLV